MNLEETLRTMADDERAISPVIGVILMISLAVIVASMVGGFTLGMGDNIQQQPPDAGFTFDYNANAGTITVTHDGGQPLTEDNTQSLIVRQTGSTTASVVWVDGSTGTVPDGSYSREHWRSFTTTGGSTPSDGLEIVATETFIFDLNS